MILFVVLGLLALAGRSVRGCLIPYGLRHRVVGIWSPDSEKVAKLHASSTWSEPRYWYTSKNTRTDSEPIFPYNNKDVRSVNQILQGHTLVVDCNSHVYSNFEDFNIKTFKCAHYNSFADKSCDTSSDNVYIKDFTVLKATSMSLSAAVQYCTRNGGNLATVRSNYDNEMALKVMLIRDIDSALIGFTDSKQYGAYEGGWKWMNDAKVSYTNWYDDKIDNNWDQPNNYRPGEHHAMLTVYQRRQYGKWFDVGPPRSDNFNIFPNNIAPFLCTLDTIGDLECEVGSIRNGYLASRAATVPDGARDRLLCRRGYKPTFRSVRCEYPVLTVGRCIRDRRGGGGGGGGGSDNSAPGDCVPDYGGAAGRSAGVGGGRRPPSYDGGLPPCKPKRPKYPARGRTSGNDSGVPAYGPDDLAASASISASTSATSPTAYPIYNEATSTSQLYRGGGGGSGRSAAGPTESYDG